MKNGIEKRKKEIEINKDEIEEKERLNKEERKSLNKEREREAVPCRDVDCVK